jgi:serine/threonine protein kinase
MKRIIASGGNGVVHLATYKSMDVAVKRILPSSMEGNSDALRDFMDEIRLCASMDHPHIVRFIGYVRTIKSTRQTTWKPFLIGV